MKIFLTGAFGSVGTSTLKKLIAKNYEITCFDIKNKQNEKKWKKLSKDLSFKTIWGDITDQEAVLNAMVPVDCILHVAAIIPPTSEKFPDLTMKVNVEGTANIISATKKLENKPKIIYVSSVSVHGPRMHLEPPVKASDPLNPTNVYTNSKVKAEKIVRESGLPWTIVRLGGVFALGADFTILTEMFEAPYEQRMEFIHVEDVATALVNGVEAKINEKVLLLGGGKDFQFYGKDLYPIIVSLFGVKELPKSAFKPAGSPEENPDDWYFVDWMDTEEAQSLLDFQNHSFEDYLNDIKKFLGIFRHFAKLFSPILYKFILKKSPYYSKV